MNGGRVRVDYVPSTGRECTVGRTHDNSTDSNRRRAKPGPQRTRGSGTSLRAALAAYPWSGFRAGRTDRRQLWKLHQHRRRYFHRRRHAGGISRLGFVPGLHRPQQTNDQQARHQRDHAHMRRTGSVCADGSRRIRPFRHRRRNRALRAELAVHPRVVRRHLLLAAPRPRNEHDHGCRLRVRRAHHQRSGDLSVHAAARIRGKLRCRRARAAAIPLHNMGAQATPTA